MDVSVREGLFVGSTLESDPGGLSDLDEDSLLDDGSGTDAEAGGGDSGREIIVGTDLDRENGDIFGVELLKTVLVV